MRLRSMFLLAVLMAACSTTTPAANVPSTPPTPSVPPAPPSPPALSPEAAATFARAEAPGGPGGALVVNLDAMAALGLAGRGPTLHELSGLAATVLAQLSVEDGPEGRQYAQGAVALTLLREWARWPSVRRFAVIVPSDRVLREGNQALADEMVGALAVDEGSPENPELIAGVAALLRASVAEVNQGKELHMVMRGQDLCVEGQEVGASVCIRPRKGLMLMGTSTALNAFEALPPVVAPPAAPGEAPLLMAMRVDMGAEGRGRLALTGRDAVRLSLNVENAPPASVSRLDSVVKKGLADYDAHQVAVRERVSNGLTDVKRALIQDPAAPASLKQAATPLTVEKVLDEKGYWTQTRQSVQTAATQNAFSLSLTVPAGAVRELSTQLSGGGGALPLVGIMSALALPNFTKFQSRSKQAEVRSNLKAAYTGQRVFLAEKNRWGRSFKEIGFAPEPGRRYTYCMGKQCLPCDLAGCQATPGPSPCEGLSSVGKTSREGFSICAYANLDSDETWDVWLIDEDGEPRPLSNDLE